jgi:hypothetical protein
MTEVFCLKAFTDEHAIKLLTLIKECEQEPCKHFSDPFGANSETPDSTTQFSHIRFSSTPSHADTLTLWYSCWIGAKLKRD